VSQLPFDRFLEQDLTRIGEPLLARAMAIDGQRLILSGATGFFGKSLLALLALLHRRGARFEVSGMSRNPEAFFHHEPWAGGQPWFRLHQGRMESAWPMAGPHSLMLHAATERDAAVRADQAGVFDGIVAGTRQALACAAACGVQRLLLTGSGAQYGAIHPGPQGQGIAETSAQACMPNQAGSAYGEGKRVAELFAALHAQAHGTAVVNARCFAFIGPGLPLHGHFVVGNLIADALAGRPLTLLSDGSAVRSWLYAADLALWLLLLLLEAPGGSVVNVGSDEACTVRAAAERLRLLLAPQAALHLGAPRPDEPRSFYLPSVARAAQSGLAVWTPLDLAFQRTAAWHRGASHEN
jgi:nucleoside-diphosphate-sugar epimerase